MSDCRELYGSRYPKRAVGKYFKTVADLSTLMRRFKTGKMSRGALLRLGALFETAIRGRVGAVGKERPDLSSRGGRVIKI